MNRVLRWGILSLAAVLLFGCSLFRRDLKDASDSAQISEPAVVEERVAGGGPTAGEQGLETAPNQSFDWSEPDKTTPSAPSNLPPRVEDTAEPKGGGIESALASPVAPKRQPLETELPAAAPVPPEPSGKPVTPSALAGAVGVGQPSSSPEDSSDLTALSAAPPRSNTLVGGNPFLPRGGPDEELPDPPPNPTGGLTLRAPHSLPAAASGGPEEASRLSPGFPQGGKLSPAEAKVANREPIPGDLARAVRSSGLSTGHPDPWREPGPSGFVATGVAPSESKPQDSASPLDDQGMGGLETRSSAAHPLADNVKSPPVGSVGAAPAPEARPAAEALPDPKTLKAQGVQQYRDKQFEAAILTFRKYLSAYPDEDQEVRWRLANSLLLSKRWGEASKEFNVLRGSQRPEFVADAILKLGKIDQIKGDLPGAKLNWKRVVEKYPNTDAAREAAKLLAENP